MSAQNNHQTITPAASFAEIVGLIAALPPLAPVPADFSANNSLGDWGTAALWLGQSQHRFPPRLNRPRLALFIAPHGHAGTVDIADLLAPWQNGQTPTSRLLAAQSEIDLQVYEMASSLPTGDITQAPALTEAAAAHAMAYGMMAAEPGLDLLCMSTVSDAATGADISALVVLCALLKVQPATLNLTDDVTAKLDAALNANRAHLTDPLTILATLGGYESCAIMGAILAARLAQTPVVLEGLPALAACVTLIKLGGTNARDLLAHARITSTPDWLQSVIDKNITQLPNASVPRGDGLQAASALPLLRAAL